MAGSFFSNPIFLPHPIPADPEPRTRPLQNFPRDRTQIPPSEAGGPEIRVEAGHRQDNPVGIPRLVGGVVGDQRTDHLRRRPLGRAARMCSSSSAGTVTSVVRRGPISSPSAIKCYSGTSGIGINSIKNINLYPSKGEADRAEKLRESFEVDYEAPRQAVEDAEGSAGRAVQSAEAAADSAQLAIRRLCGKRQTCGQRNRLTVFTEHAT